MVKNLPASWIPGSGRSPGEGNGNPLQYSGLENPTDRGTWRATVHGVTNIICSHIKVAHSSPFAASASGPGSRWGRWPLRLFLLGQEATPSTVQCWLLRLALLRRGRPGTVSPVTRLPAGASRGPLRTASGCRLLQSDEEGGPDNGGEDGQQKFIAHVPVPSQQEVGRRARRVLFWVLLSLRAALTLGGGGRGRGHSAGCRPSLPLPPADRGGAGAQKEDGAATEVCQRDAAGPERGGPCMRNLRSIELRWLAQGYIAAKWKSCNLNLCLFDSRAS